MGFMISTAMVVYSGTFNPKLRQTLAIQTVIIAVNTVPKHRHS